MDAARAGDAIESDAIAHRGRRLDASLHSRGRADLRIPGRSWSLGISESATSGATIVATCAHGDRLRIFDSGRGVHWLIRHLHTGDPTV